MTTPTPAPMIKEIPAGEFVVLTHQDMVDGRTPPPCPAGLASHTVIPGLWGPPNLGLVDGMTIQLPHNPVVEGVPMFAGRTYAGIMSWRCEYLDDNGEKQQTHSQNLPLNLVTTGSHQSHAHNAHLHHDHPDPPHQHNHHHLHADTPETLAIAAHTAELTRLAARVAALENASGQVASDSETTPDSETE